MWTHIEWFIEEMGATILEEVGEHSSEEDEFQVMGRHLADATGIEFEGGIEEKMNKLRDECQEIANTFENSYPDGVSRSGLDIDSNDYADVGWAIWSDSIDAIAVQLPFDR